MADNLAQEGKMELGEKNGVMPVSGDQNKTKLLSPGEKRSSANHQQQKPPAIITNNDIKLAIKRSGYLIEQRVADTLTGVGYYVNLNPTFPDLSTGKAREIDIQADSTLVSPTTKQGFITGVHCSIMCECENNAQPIVFFPYQTLEPSLRYEFIKFVGVPTKIWVNNKYVDFRHFFLLANFHHYCRDEIATRYCSFVKAKHPNEGWLATHEEEQHDTFNKLVSSIRYNIEDFSKDWDLPENDNEEPLYLEFLYPLIVLGGRLMEAKFGTRGLTLKRTRHIKYLKSDYLEGKQENYIVDVITEDYLKEYVFSINREIKRVRRLVKKAKEDIDKSILHIIGDARATDSSTDAYRRLVRPIEGIGG